MKNLIDMVVGLFLSTKEEVVLAGTTARSNTGKISIEWEIPEKEIIPRDLVSELQDFISKTHGIYFESSPLREVLVSIRTVYTSKTLYFLGKKVAEKVTRKNLSKYEP